MSTDLHDIAPIEMSPLPFAPKSQGEFANYEQFLSPLRHEREGLQDYCKRVWKIFTTRILSFIQDLFSKCVWRWKNDAYFTRSLRDKPIHDYWKLRLALADRNAEMIDTSLVTMMERLPLVKKHLETARNYLKEFNGKNLIVKLYSEKKNKPGCNVGLGEIRLLLGEHLSDKQIAPTLFSDLIFELGNMINICAFYKREKKKKMSEQEYTAITDASAQMHSKLIKEQAQQSGMEGFAVLDTYKTNSTEKPPGGPTLNGEPSPINPPFPLFFLLGVTEADEQQDSRRS